MKKAKKLVKVVSDEKDFSAVLDIITTHRSRALMSVNVESLLTYWEIGAFLSPRIHSGSWSTAVVGQLADYIKRNNPELRGYGKSNLYNMASVYDLFSDESFLSLTHRYKKQLSVPDNFFQLQNGKSDKGSDKVGACVNGISEFNIFQMTSGKCETRKCQIRSLSENSVKVAAGNVLSVSDIFQPTVGKRFHRHNPLPRREPHRGRVRHVACNEPGHGGAVQATAYSQGGASADFRGVS